MSAWAVVGAEVVECSSSWGPFPHYGRVSKIAKVHKNGNFVVEGDSTRQWRPGRDYASQAGSSRGSTTLIPLNDETRAAIHLAQRYRTARDSVEREATRLEKVWRHGDPDEVIAEAAKIEARSE